MRLIEPHDFIGLDEIIPGLVAGYRLILIRVSDVDHASETHYGTAIYMKDKWRGPIMVSDKTHAVLDKLNGK